MNNDFSKEDKVVVKVLHQKRVMETKVKKIYNEFPNRNWSPSSLNKMLPNCLIYVKHICSTFYVPHSIYMLTANGTFVFV